MDSKKRRLPDGEAVGQAHALIADRRATDGRAPTGPTSMPYIEEAFKRRRLDDAVICDSPSPNQPNQPNEHEDNNLNMPSPASQLTATRSAANVIAQAWPRWGSNGQAVASQDERPKDLPSADMVERVSNQDSDGSDARMEEEESPGDVLVPQEALSTECIESQGYAMAMEFGPLPNDPEQPQMVSLKVRTAAANCSEGHFVPVQTTGHKDAPPSQDREHSRGSVISPAKQLATVPIAATPTAFDEGNELSTEVVPQRAKETAPSPDGTQPRQRPDWQGSGKMEATPAEPSTTVPLERWTPAPSNKNEDMPEDAVPLSDSDEGILPPLAQSASELHRQPDWLGSSTPVAAPDGQAAVIPSQQWSPNRIDEDGGMSTEVVPQSGEEPMRSTDRTEHRQGPDWQGSGEMDATPAEPLTMVPLGHWTPAPSDENEDMPEDVVPLSDSDEGILPPLAQSASELHRQPDWLSSSTPVAVPDGQAAVIPSQQWSPNTVDEDGGMSTEVVPQSGEEPMRSADRTEHRQGPDWQGSGEMDATPAEPSTMVPLGHWTPAPSDENKDMPEDVVPLSDSDEGILPPLAQSASELHRQPDWLSSSTPVAVPDGHASVIPSQQWSPNTVDEDGGMSTEVVPQSGEDPMRSADRTEHRQGPDWQGSGEMDATPAEPSTMAPLGHWTPEPSDENEDMPEDVVLLSDSDEGILPPLAQSASKLHRQPEWLGSSTPVAAPDGQAAVIPSQQWSPNTVDEDGGMSTEVVPQSGEEPMRSADRTEHSQGPDWQRSGEMDATPAEPSTMVPLGHWTPAPSDENEDMPEDVVPLSDSDEGILPPLAQSASELHRQPDWLGSSTPVAAPDGQAAVIPSQQWSPNTVDEDGGMSTEVVPQSGEDPMRSADRTEHRQGPDWQGSGEMDATPAEPSKMAPLGHWTPEPYDENEDMPEDVVPLSDRDEGILPPLAQSARELRHQPGWKGSGVPVTALGERVKSGPLSAWMLETFNEGDEMWPTDVMPLNNILQPLARLPRPVQQRPSPQVGHAEGADGCSLDAAHTSVLPSSASETTEDDQLDSGDVAGQVAGPQWIFDAFAEDNQTTGDVFSDSDPTQKQSLSLPPGNGDDVIPYWNPCGDEASEFTSSPGYSDDELLWRSDNTVVPVVTGVQEDEGGILLARHHATLLPPPYGLPTNASPQPESSHASTSPITVEPGDDRAFAIPANGWVPIVEEVDEQPQEAALINASHSTQPSAAWAPEVPMHANIDPTHHVVKPQDVRPFSGPTSAWKPLVEDVDAAFVPTETILSGPKPSTEGAALDLTTADASASPIVVEPSDDRAFAIPANGWVPIVEEVDEQPQEATLINASHSTQPSAAWAPEVPMHANIDPTHHIVKPQDVRPFSGPTSAWKPLVEDVDAAFVPTETILSGPKPSTEGAALDLTTADASASPIVVEPSDDRAFAIPANGWVPIEEVDEQPQEATLINASHSTQPSAAWAPEVPMHANIDPTHHIVKPQAVRPFSGPTAAWKPIAGDAEERPEAVVPTDTSHPAPEPLADWMPKTVESANMCPAQNVDTEAVGGAFVEPQGSRPFPVLSTAWWALEHVSDQTDLVLFTDASHPASKPLPEWAPVDPSIVTSTAGALRWFVWPRDLTSATLPSSEWRPIVEEEDLLDWTPADEGDQGDLPNAPSDNHFDPATSPEPETRTRHALTPSPPPPAAGGAPDHASEFDDESDAELIAPQPTRAQQKKKRRMMHPKTAEERERQMTNKIRDAVRNFMKDLKLTAASAVAARRCNAHQKDKHHPAKREGGLKYDLHGTMRSHWNRALQKAIYDGILASEETSLPRSADKKMVQHAIKVHLKYTIYKDKNYPRPLAPRVQSKCSRYGRTYYTLRRRRKALAYFSRRGDPTLKRALEIFDTFDSSAMSDDEPDTDNPRQFVVQTPAWRNPASVVTQFFTLPDYLALSLSFDINGDWSRLPGQIARLRIDKGIIDAKASPPIGLARNLYDPVWLAGLPEFTLERLNVQPDIDLNELQYSNAVHRFVNHIKGKVGKYIAARHTNI